MTPSEREEIEKVDVVEETWSAILDQMDWDDEGELDRKATIKDFLIVQKEGSRDETYKKAGGRERLEESLMDYLERQFNRFALTQVAKARAEERERCAKIAEDCDIESSAAILVSKAIRNKLEKE